MLKLLSWNVNGIRSLEKKGFLDWLTRESPDILSLQETKAQPEQLSPELLHPPGYHAFWNAPHRRGYSGVATFSKRAPVLTQTGFDLEGRILETEFREFTLLNIYFPNGKASPERLQYKLDFYEEALKYFRRLRRRARKLVIAGDVNTAHKLIDLAHPKANEDVSGFLPIERAWIDRFLRAGFLDTFRVFNQGPGHYTWWDLKTAARERNVGWRIDYIFISEDLRPHLKDAFILPEVMGSDHCPV